MDYKNWRPYNSEVGKEQLEIIGNNYFEGSIGALYRPVWGGEAKMNPPIPFGPLPNPAWRHGKPMSEEEDPFASMFTS